MKLAGHCKTHHVRMTHFTGPVSEPTLVRCSVAMSGPVMMEMTSADGSVRTW